MELPISQVPLTRSIEAPPPVRVPDSSPAPRGVPGTVDLLLRDQRATLARIDDGVDLAGFARAMLVTIAVGAGAFGVSMGAWRGGLQILLAGVKLPIVVLLTAALCAPATTALNAALGRRADLRRDLALVLASLALGTLVLAALAPIVLLADTMGIEYHSQIVVVVCCCLVAGIAGVAFLLSALSEEPKGFVSLVCVLLGVVMLVGTQMAWIGRPWLTRPRTQGVVFLRAVDDQGFFDSVLRSVDSAGGDYAHERELLPGEGDSSAGEER